jgi:hypothetical protein
MTPAKPYTPAEERDAALGLAWAVADAEVFEVAPVLDVAVAEPDALHELGISMHLQSILIGNIRRTRPSC